MKTLSNSVCRNIIRKNKTIFFSSKQSPIASALTLPLCSFDFPELPSSTVARTSDYDQVTQSTACFHLSHPVSASCFRVSAVDIDFTCFHLESM